MLYGIAGRVGEHLIDTRKVVSHLIQKSCASDSRPICGLSSMIIALYEPWTYTSNAIWKVWGKGRRRMNLVRFPLVFALSASH